MRKIRQATIAGGAVLALFAGQAQAATTIGQASGTSTTGCAADYTWVQAATAATTPSYAVPAGGE